MPDLPNNHPVYPVRLEIRRDPQNPERSTHFIAGRPVTARMYTDFCRDLFYRVARQETLLVLIEAPHEETQSNRVIDAEPPGMISVYTEDMSVNLIPLQRENLERYLKHHQQYRAPEAPYATTDHAS